MPPRRPAEHKKLPDGSFMVCHLCVSHAEKQENEMSRHYRHVHKDRTEFVPVKGATKTPYHLCRLVPEAVAVLLVGQEHVDRQNDRSYTSINRKPKTPVADRQDLAGMLAYRGIPAPAWLATVRLVNVNAAAGPATAATPQSTNISAPALPASAPPVLVTNHAAAARTSPTTGYRASKRRKTTDNTPSRLRNSTSAQDSDESEMDIDEDDASEQEEGSTSSIDVEDFPLISTALLVSPVFPEPGVDEEEDVYECHICMDSSATTPPGDMLSMFYHYLGTHAATLQAAFSKNYAGRYLAAITEHTKNQDRIEYGALAEKVAQMGMRIAPFGVPERTVDIDHGRCYLCLNDKAMFFNDLDKHFKQEHKEARWDVACDIILGFQENAE